MPVPFNRTMTDRQLKDELNTRVARVDNTVKLGKYCIERARMDLPNVILNDELAMKYSGEINHEAIIGYIELHGYKAESINYQGRQGAIRIDHP